MHGNPSAMVSRVGLFALLSLSVSSPVGAQDDEVPYWASVTADEVNMRVGPATSYRIDWVYKRKLLPLKVLRRKEGWRLVEDPDGARGWVVARFLSRDRTAIVIGQGLAPMRNGRAADGMPAKGVEPGVVGKLGDCADGWCSLEVGPYEGLVPRDRLWGAGPP